MVFTDIRVQNYRSYADSSFDLGEGVTIVVGPNAVGKTNLLEAIMVAAIGKSYRASHDKLVQHNKSWARIDAHTSENSIRTAKIKITPDSFAEKTFEVDGKIYKRLPKTQAQPLVLFEPNDLRILEGEPSGRREYLDNIIEQLVFGYSTVRSQYKRALAQRNALLKSQDTNKSLFVWDVRLCELASQIVKERLCLVGDINERLSEVYSKIANQKTSIKLEYKTNLEPDNYGSSMLKKLQDGIEFDKLSGFTRIGPHREDIGINVQDNIAEFSASRGETRTILLALKIIELQLLEERREIKPTLLLDDVFSELDGSRRKALTGFLKNYQTIITTTDADIISKQFSQNCQIIPL